MKTIVTTSLIVIPLVIAAMCVLVGLSVLWSGFVLSTMWSWFIVGQFGLPALGVVQAAGVAAVIRFMAYVPDAKKLLEESESEFEFKPSLKILGFSFLYPLMVLAMAWVLHLFL